MKFTRSWYQVLAVVLVLLVLLCTLPAAAQSYGDYRSNAGGGFTTNGAICWEVAQMSGAVTCNTNVGVKGATQGTASIPNTGTSDLTFGASNSILITPNEWVAGKVMVITGHGRYTNAAASLISLKVKICQVLNCASGTVVSPAGCNVISTNQANNLTNGQFNFECYLSVASVGAATAGTVFAHQLMRINLGAATTAALSSFQDTSTAVSAGFDTTVNEFITPTFTYATSNAGNSEILDDLVVSWVK